jgi:UDPglucose--hexose-1-phosphate uridylyltransferase
MISHTRGKLADGRSIHYFDSKTGRNPGPDQRLLKSSSGVGEIRFDMLNGDWVTIAEHRQGRKHLPSASECPLCPSTERVLTEVPDSGYEVAVFDNRFPSFSGDAATTTRLEENFFSSGPNSGHTEVVCFTPQHTLGFADLSVSHVELIIGAFAQRTGELLSRADVEYVFIFENHGTELGVTLEHPHGQIYAYPFVPPKISRIFQRMDEFYKQQSIYLHDYLLREELLGMERIVEQSDNWVVLVPFAARWPYQVNIVPKIQFLDLPSLSKADRHELAEVYLRTLQRFRGLFDVKVPYIATWNQTPQGCNGGRFFIDIFTNLRDTRKFKHLAGSEVGAEAFISDISPERAAERLREVKV